MSIISSVAMVVIATMSLTIIFLVATDRVAEVGVWLAGIVGALSVIYILAWGSLALLCVCVLTTGLIIALILRFSRIPWSDAALIASVATSMLIGCITATLIKDQTTTVSYKLWQPAYTYELVQAKATDGKTIVIYYRDGNNGRIFGANAALEDYKHPNETATLIMITDKTEAPRVVSENKTKIMTCWLTGETVEQWTEPHYTVFMHSEDLCFWVTA